MVFTFNTTKNGIYSDLCFFIICNFYIKPIWNIYPNDIKNNSNISLLCRNIYTTNIKLFFNPANTLKYILSKQLLENQLITVNIHKISNKNNT